MATRWLPPFAQPPPGYRIDWDAVGLPRPIAQWRFNVPGSALVPDIERTGLHAYITGQSAGSVWVTTPWGPATQLASSPAAAWVVPFSQTLAWPASMTVAAHMLFPDTWVDRAVPAAKSTSIWQWQMQTGTSPDKWGYRYGSYVWANLPSASTSLAGKPVVVVGSHDGDNIGGINRVGMWMPDGLSVVTTASNLIAPIATSNDTVGIGNRSNLGYTNYTGAIFCITLWQTSLQLDMAAQLAGPLPMWVPQRYWMFGAVAGTTIAVPWHLIVRKVN